jgi:hypothetical protein
VVAVEVDLDRSDGGVQGGDSGVLRHKDNSYTGRQRRPERPRAFTAFNS